MKKIFIKNTWWLIAAAWVYTLAYIFNNYWSKSSSFTVIAQSFEKRLATEVQNFDALCSDTTAIKQLLANKNLAEQNLHSFYYVYLDGPDGLQLKYWSTAAVLPAKEQVPYIDTLMLVTKPSGLFLLNVHNLKSQAILLVQLVPIKWQYFIANDNLSIRYPGFAGMENFISISTTPGGYPVKIAKQGTLFYLEKNSSKPFKLFNWPSFFLELLIVFFVAMFCHRVANGLVAAGHFLIGLVWVVVSISGMRMLLWFYNWPVNFKALELFQPIVWKGPFPLFSLGDLLLHLIAFVWFLVFLRNTSNIWIAYINTWHKVLKKILASVLVVSMVPISFFLAHVIKLLVLQPEVSFDVFNFFSLGWNTFSSILCLYFIAAFHYQLLHLFNKIFNAIWPYNGVFKIVTSALIGLICITLAIDLQETRFSLFILIWLLVTLILEDWVPQWFTNKVATATWYMFWMIWYAFSAMLIIQNENGIKETAQRKMLAHKFGIQQDPATQSLLYQSTQSQIIRALDTSFAALADTGNNIFFRKQLLQQQFNGYLNSRYKTSFFIFDAQGNALLNADSTKFEALNTILDQEAKSTKYPGIYFFESSFENFSYIIRQPIFNPYKIVQGYLFITCTPTKIKPDALVPELLKPLQKNNKDNTNQYSYAIYQSGKLVYSNKDFPFETDIPKEALPKAEYENRTQADKLVLWHNAGNGRTVAVVKLSSSFSDGVTLFAYFFGAFILLQLIESLLGGIISGSIKLLKIWKASGANIKWQIQSTVLIISTVSFVLIGVSTVVFFTNRYNKGNAAKLTKIIALVDADLMRKNLATSLTTAKTFEKNLGENDALIAMINAEAELQNVDINLFNLQGDLVATSQPIVYEKGILSTKMDMAAYQNLALKKQVSFLQPAFIGTLKYQSIYVPVRTTASGTVGFLNIPYFASQIELNQEISNFLVALINFNALIFLFAGVIAFFITNRITGSFSLIAEKMKAVGFGKNNEPIPWTRDDEIGSLVLQYNKMILQLDDSAKQLAKNERESAWREMAKQVAHEIKNPLTPMKLSLQYLQKAIDSNSANVKELSRQVATNLVEQIEHLSRIASDFSQFAQINIAKTEVFDLHDILQQVVMLYETDMNANIRWNIVGKPLQVDADKTQINRLFTNLVKNACEASSFKPSIHITINEVVQDQHVTIGIADEGTGIDDGLTDKIFTPNFTTKTSGTGLGLAICKDIVEKANGDIWFETVVGVGTVFFVRLPLLQKLIG